MPPAALAPLIPALLGRPAKARWGSNYNKLARIRCECDQATSFLCCSNTSPGAGHLTTSHLRCLLLYSRQFLTARPKLAIIG